MRLRTIGRLHLVNEQGSEVALQPLPLALLAYLTVGGPRNREHLVDLFWHSSKNGRNSLSTTLNRIRAEVPAGIWARGHSLIGSGLASDVDEIRVAIERSEFETVERLYEGAFLGAFSLRGQSVEFEDWVLDERAKLAAAVEQALLQWGRSLCDAGDQQGGARAVEQAWEIAIRDGFPAPDHFEEYHRILASAGRPGANAVRSMAAEFGMALQPVKPVVTGLATAQPDADQGATDGLARLWATDSDIRTSAPLFGFEQELNAIGTSVVAHSVTTVVGLGGSGKTRLAAEFFHGPDAESSFPRRYWVDLREVTDQGLVAPTIANSLGHRFDSVASLAEGFGSEDPALLVLDNFEQVLASVDVVRELSQRNAALRILVTSRLPLQLPEESLVQLSGLGTAEVAHDSPAVQLFLSSARRAGVSEDRLTSTNPVAIQNVCRSVGGNPLALEIAGGWVRVLSPTEIVSALEHDTELLDVPVDGALRSMDLVLKQSWATLDESEQKALMLLAFFPAGLLTSEAIKLQELSIRSVGRLVQHSLIRLHVEGRISLHPLIAAHALSELRSRPTLEQKFREVLSTWCESFSARALTADATRTHSQVFGVEIANFSKAWRSNARNESWGTIEATIQPLREFFTESGRISEGQALFAAVGDIARSAQSAPPGLVAAIIEALGWFQVLTGDLARARALLDEALTLSSRSNRHVHAQILRSLANLHLAAGEVEESNALITEALALVGKDGSALTASLQSDLAQLYLYRGDAAKATDAARSALAAGRSANNPVAIAHAYLLLADIAVDTDPERAVVLLNEGQVVAEEAALDNLAIYFPHILGVAHLKLLKPDLAERYFTEGIDAANKVGQSSTVGANYVGRAEARLQSKQHAKAIEDLKAGIRLALKTNTGRYLMWAAVVSCRATDISESPLRADLTKRLLHLAYRHPAADQGARDKAAKALRELFNENPPPDETGGEEPPAGFDEVAERSLQLFTLR